MSTTKTFTPQTGGSRPVRNQLNQAPAGLQPGRDLLNYMKTYAREKPDVAALWCLGLGIIVGWKIKPW